MRATLGALLVLRVHPAVWRAVDHLSSSWVQLCSICFWSFLSCSPGCFLSCREQTLGVTLDAEHGAERGGRGGAASSSRSHLQGRTGNHGEDSTSAAAAFSGDPKAEPVDRGLSTLPL